MNCNIKGLTLNYEIIGNGKPIIMLHGYAVDHRLMSGCMEPVFNVNDNYKRIYLDLPGMGKSECAEWIKNADDMLEILIEFINYIVPNENYILAGESYGGYLSRGILYRMADRIDGVLLICPVIIPDHKKREVPGHMVLVKDEELLSKLTLEDKKDFNSNFIIQTAKNFDRYQKEIKSGLEMANKAFVKNYQNSGYEFSFDVDKIIEKYQKPALILLGKQDSCVGYKDGWSILDNFIRATFTIVDQAGHNLQIEQEELFNSLVKEWLLRIVEY